MISNSVESIKEGLLIESKILECNLDVMGSKLLECNLDERNLYTYLIIDAHHSKSGNIIDTFAPFIILYLGEQDSGKRIEDVKEGIKDKYNIDLKIAILDSLLLRLKIDGIIELEPLEYKISEDIYNKKLDALENPPPNTEKILSILKNYGAYVGLDKIAKELDLIYRIKISNNDLKFILNKLKDLRYVTSTDFRYKLTNKGLREDYIYIKNKSDGIKELQELINDFKDYYYNETSNNIADEWTKTYILLFVYKNIKPLVGLLNTGKYEKINECCGIGKEYEELSQEFGVSFCDYVRDCINKGKVRYIEIIKSLVLGSIIYTVFFTKFELTKITFKDVIVYLDTNILFYILGQHFDQFTQPASILFDLLKEHGAKFKVFDFTIEEARSVFRDCIEKYDELFFPGVKVNDICYFLRSIGKTIIGINLLINEFEHYIEQKGIEIEPTDINIKDFECDYKIREKLKKYKPKQKNVWAQNHDIASIQEIQRIRRSTSYNKIGDCKAIFLTADEGLFAFNLIECGHKDYTVPEVFVDRLLTNILWIMNPSQDISIETFFADCLRAGFLSRELWEVVQERIKYLHEARKMDDSDIFGIIYCGFISSKSFRGISSEEIEIIDKKLLSNAVKSHRERTKYDEEMKQKNGEISRLKTQLSNQQDRIERTKSELNEKNTLLEREKFEKNRLEEKITDLNDKMKALSHQISNKEEAMDKFINEIQQDYAKKKNFQKMKLEQRHKSIFEKTNKILNIFYAIFIIILIVSIAYILYSFSIENRIPSLALLLSGISFFVLILNKSPWPKNKNIGYYMYHKFVKEYGIIMSYFYDNSTNPKEYLLLDYVGHYPIDLNHWKIVDGSNNDIYNFKYKVILEPKMKIKIFPGSEPDDSIDNKRLYSGKDYLIAESKPKIAYLMDRNLIIVDQI